MIGWKLASSGHDAQLRTLTELRAAVEPMAALHAAERATDAQRERLAVLADRLKELGSSGRGDRQEFLDADIEFHTLLLVASGNDMFASLADAISEVLVGRTRLGLQPEHPEPEALHRHIELARAVSAGDRAAAELHARGLVTEVREALKDI
ncbi:FadR/GntR family transcriptional regulator [Tessaracoccus coleopterorum]|uniref:FadR/GntR family transcriptional regulator n=1 Tax=Tessaracoccus coleopterorum TaxID=2714950 RepID=UPI0018D3B38E